MPKDDALRELADQAREALAKEQELLVVKLGNSIWKSVPNGVLSQWTEAISTIEANGWVLDKWSVAIDGGSTPYAFPIFRRKEATARFSGSVPSGADGNALTSEPPATPQST